VIAGDYLSYDYQLAKINIFVIKTDPAYCTCEWSMQAITGMGRAQRRMDMGTTRKSEAQPPSLDLIDFLFSFFTHLVDNISSATFRPRFNVWIVGKMRGSNVGHAATYAVVQLLLFCTRVKAVSPISWEPSEYWYVVSVKLCSETHYLHGH
jgi:hypothetical protein